MVAANRRQRKCNVGSVRHAPPSRASSPLTAAPEQCAGGRDAAPCGRLLRRKEFLAVRKGEKRRGRLFLLEVLDRGDGGVPRVGMTITTKVGNAVERNRIRRRLREAVRLFATRDMQPGNDYVIVAHADLLGARFEDIKAELSRRLRRTPRSS